MRTPQVGDDVFLYDSDIEEYLRENVAELGDSVAGTDLWEIYADGDMGTILQVRWNEDLEGWLADGLDVVDFEHVR